MNNLDKIRAYLKLVDGFCTDPERFLEFVLPTCQWVEYPNAITAQTKVRDFAETVRGSAAGRALLSRQTIAITAAHEAGATVVVEGLWEGTVGAAVGTFTPGQVLRAHLAIVFTLEDGKIARQVNYDCFDRF